MAAVLKKLKRVYRSLFKNPPRYRIDRRMPTERHGSDYGGWHLVAGSLHADSVVVSAGVGKDISFDRSLIQQYGCSILAYDPTPEVADWIAAQDDLSGFQFHPTGLAAQTTTLRLYLPQHADHISHTFKPNGRDEFIEVPCLSLEALTEQAGISSIDLLKMDIEGAEFELIHQFANHEIRPAQLLVEFHHFMDGFDNRDTEAAIETLRRLGYQLIYVSDNFCEYTFYFA